MIDEARLLADRRDIAKCLARQVGLAAARDHPGSEIGRRQTTARRRDIAMRGERCVDDGDTGLHHPWLCGEVGARGQVADQAEPGQQQRPRTLCRDQLPRRIETKPGQHRRIGGDLARAGTAADQHRIRLLYEFQRPLALDGDAVQRRHRLGRRRDVRGPPMRAQPVDDRGSHERIQFVEAVEGQDRDLHHPCVRPENSVRVAPATQTWPVSSCETWIRPLRPRQVPCAAT